MRGRKGSISEVSMGGGASGVATSILLLSRG